MIQPSPSLTIAGSALPSDVAALPSMTGPVTADFAALLAITTASPTDPVSAALPSTMSSNFDMENTADPAMPGKTLPPALPVEGQLVIVQTEFVQPDAIRLSKDEQPKEAKPKPDRGLRATPAVAAPIDEPKVGKLAEDPLPQTPDTPQEPVDRALAPPVETLAPVTEFVTATASQPDAAPASVPDQPGDHTQPSAAAPTPHPKAQAFLHRTMPTRPEQASEKAQSRTKLPMEAEAIRASVAAIARQLPVPGVVRSPQTTKAIPATEESLSIPPEIRLSVAGLAPRSTKVASANPAPAEEVRIELALPRPVTNAAPARTDSGLATPITDLNLPDVVPQSTAAPAQPPIASSVQATPQLRPHDFAALIDRLTLARDVAAPQSVSITVGHQDFGPVRLHFSPEDAGLSVAMTSADPDFARAAAAAPAPILAASQTEQTSFTQSRTDNAPAQSSQSGGFSHSRGQASERREGQGQPHSNPSPRARQNNHSPRPGIFA